MSNETLLREDERLRLATMFKGNACLSSVISVLLYWYWGCALTLEVRFIGELCHDFAVQNFVLYLAEFELRGY